MIRKIAVAGLVTGMMAFGSAGIASAAPSIVPSAVHTASEGTSGIEALHGNTMSNMGATIVTSPAALNIGGVGQGGIGEQLCDPNTGQGLQIGLTSNGSSFSVEYAIGTLAGAAKFVCEGDGVLANPHVLNANLTGIGVGDVVKVYESFRNVLRYRWAKTHWVRMWQGRATFQAYDQSTGSGPYTAYVRTAPIWNLDSAGAGVQQNTTLLSACTPVVPMGSFFSPNQSTTGDNEYNEAYTGGSGACNLVAAFSNIFTDGNITGVLGTGPGLTVTGQWNEVVTTGGGLPGNAALVATNDTLSPDFQSFSPSSLDVFAGQVTG